MGFCVPRRVTRAWLPLLLLPLISCGGSREPPSSPSVNPMGTWKGTNTVSSATPASHCVAGLLRAAFSAPQPATLTVTAQGAVVSVKSANDLTGTSCDYIGQISASGEITATLERCSIPGLTGIVCADGLVRDIRISGGRVAVQVSGNQMTGTESGNYEVSLSPSGAPDGSLTISSTIRVTRQ